MGCTIFDFGDGTTAIICSRGERKRYCSCGRVANKLCDFPLHGSKTGKTCDRPICDRCATSVGEDRDYCPPHSRQGTLL
jgi:hypothetical protein